jgi:hypothetical protein
MNKVIIAVAAVIGLAATECVAADLPIKAPPKGPTVAVASWTGCYVGIGGGYGMWNQDSTSLQLGTPTTATWTSGGRGYFGTVQAGCDYQIMPSIVGGAFADWDYGSIKGTTAPPAFAEQGEEKLRSSWAVGGRIGWLPVTELLTFFSGGYTQAHFDQFNLTPFATANYIPAQTYKGWFVGGGYEYVLGFIPGLTWKTEYRFADYGSEPLTWVFAGAPTTLAIDSHKYVQTIRSELVWRFAAGTPVRAAVIRAPAMVAPTSWTGFYAGIGGGYGMWNQDNSMPPPTLVTDWTSGGRGYFGTVQGGYDYQVTPSIVVGAFADWDYGSMKGTMAVPALNEQGEEKLRWSWAAGGRIGWLPVPQLLTFFSGGYTQAHFDRVDFNLVGPIIPSGDSLPAQTYKGWFIGGGYEYALGFIPGLTWKTEYRFADYGSEHNPLLFSGALLAAIDSHKYVQTIRSELVWRFWTH